MFRDLNEFAFNVQLLQPSLLWFWLFVTVVHHIKKRTTNPKHTKYLFRVCYIFVYTWVRCVVALFLYFYIVVVIVVVNLIHFFNTTTCFFSYFSYFLLLLKHHLKQKGYLFLCDLRRYKMLHNMMCKNNHIDTNKKKHIQWWAKQASNIYIFQLQTRHLKTLEWEWVGWHSLENPTICNLREMVTIKTLDILVA